MRLQFGGVKMSVYGCRNSFTCRRVSLKTKGFLLTLIGRIIPLSIEKFRNL